MTGDLVAVAVGDHGIALAGDGPDRVAALADIAALEADRRPRWVMWSADTAAALVTAGVRVSRSWDIAAVHRLLFGGWRADPAFVWAMLAGLPVDTIPGVVPRDLFHQDDDPGTEPIGPDGHLHPRWAAGSWRRRPDDALRWARLALDVAHRQQEHLDRLGDRAASTARSESTAEVLCCELAVDGLPLDVATAERIVSSFVGPRPASEQEAAEARAERDGAVLSLVPGADGVDLRSPAQVRSLLRRAGIEVHDTRAWRLRTLRDAHPVVDALLAWRKAERIATTYGYAWLDEVVGDDGRLRGSWTASDGAAGRMTASAGLHNLPADLRGAVVAEPGFTFVRADLGQIEPRVLAAVSGDRTLADATRSDDMYGPVATELGVDRATAKVAVLGAMYGQTTGHGAEALWRLRAAYPVAMAYLDEADRAGQGAQDLRTYGGRLIRMSAANANDVSERDLRSHAAARGRYGRNALVQGAAAELFKVWALTVRARLGEVDGGIVLCLHDELLVHVREQSAPDAVAVVENALQEAAARWAPPSPAVRFLADTAVVRCWADAKG